MVLLPFFGEFMNIIKAIEQAEAKATKGPWLISESDSSEMGCVYTKETNVCMLLWDRDKEFIALARNNLPKLLEVIKIQGEAVELAKKSIARHLSSSDMEWHPKENLIEAHKLSDKAIQQTREIIGE